MSSLKLAIESGDKDRVLRNLKSQPELANSTISWGKGNTSSPLHYLADRFFEQQIDEPTAIEMSEILLAHHANINALSKTGDTPLISAASCGAEHLALQLLSAGADHNIKGLFGATVLHWASLLGQDRLVEALLNLGADALLKDASNKGTPLHWAVYGWTHDVPAKTNRQPACASLLVSVGCPVTGDMLLSLEHEKDGLFYRIIEPVIIEEEKKKLSKSSKQSRDK